MPLVIRQRFRSEREPQKLCDTPKRLLGPGDKVLILDFVIAIRTEVSPMSPAGTHLPGPPQRADSQRLFSPKFEFPRPPSLLCPLQGGKRHIAAVTDDMDGSGPGEQAMQ